MSTEPLWRGKTGPIPSAPDYTGIYAVFLGERNVEVEVWPAGDRTSPTREQVREAIIRGFKAAQVPQQNIFDCGADEVLALLHGQGDEADDA